MIDTPEIERIRQEWKQKKYADVDQFILRLKQADTSLLHTLWILVQELEVDVPRAQEVLFKSDSWKDHRELFEAFNDEVLDIWANDNPITNN